jgi:hypothetical protein
VYLEPTEEVGVSVRWCPLSSSSNVWHVLEVYPSSPAEIAGFIPFNDYIIGSPERTLHGESSLGELVEEVYTSSAGANYSFFDVHYDFGCTTVHMILYE